MKKKKEREEYIESLKKKGFKWITRSKHGEVQAHYTKPKRMLNFWDSKGRRQIDAMPFHNLSWNDEPLCLDRKKG